MQTCPLGRHLYQQGPERLALSWETRPATDVTQSKGCCRGRHRDEGIWLEQREAQEPVGSHQTGSVIPGREDKGSSGLSDQACPPGYPCPPSPKAGIYLGHRPHISAAEALQAWCPCPWPHWQPLQQLTLEPWHPTRSPGRLCGRLCP